MSRRLWITVWISMITGLIFTDSICIQTEGIRRNKINQTGYPISLNDMAKENEETADERTVLYAQTVLNIRKEPDVNAGILDTFVTNDEVDVTERLDESWYQIDYYGQKAYVDSRYLSDSPVSLSASAVPVTGVVETCGDVLDIWVLEADQMIAKLPQRVIDRFKASGYHFYVTDEDLGDTLFHGTIGRVAGATKYGEYIKIEDRQYAIDNAILHEFGHFVFDQCDNWDDAAVFEAFQKDVINAPAAGMDYYLDDEIEFYAEVFQKYINDPQTTAAEFPNLSAVIQSDMDSL